MKGAIRVLLVGAAAGYVAGQVMDKATTWVYDRQSDAYVREAVQKCREHIVYTHYGAWNFSEGADGEAVQDPAPSFGGEINYRGFFKALQDIGYDGYVAGEYCLPVLHRHAVAGIEEVDRATAIALRYMKRLAAETAPARPPRRALSAV